MDRVSLSLRAYSSPYRMQGQAYFVGVPDTLAWIQRHSYGGVTVDSASLLWNNLAAERLRSDCWIEGKPHKYAESILPHYENGISRERSFIVTVALYCIYRPEAFQDLYYEDVPEEAWEVCKSFDLDKKSDVRELFIHLDTHYNEAESLEVLEQVLGNGFWYDYQNWFKYLRID